jgi:Xaa-Pro dipeptidase
MDYRRRIMGLQRTMEQEGIDLVLYGSCPNFQYVTGIPVDWRLPRDLQPPGDIVLVPREGDPVLITSGSKEPNGCPIPSIFPYDRSAGYTGMLGSVIKDLCVNVRRLALGAYLPAPAVAAAVQVTRNPDLCDGSHLMDDLRMIKEPEEVEQLRKVARLTDDVMVSVIEQIREGVSQLDLMLEMEAQARRRGATGVAFSPLACFVQSDAPALKGSDAVQVSNVPIKQGLRSDTAITFDVGFVMDGYCSDWGRSVYWGSPSENTKNAHAALREAVVETVGELRDGNHRACDIYPAIEEKLDERGFGDQMRLRLAPGRTVGHQIGTEVHENPWLKPDSHEPLQAGMIMCIEPKLWAPGKHYLRQEEMVHITKTGAEFLTQFDRHLFEL